MRAVDDSIVVEYSQFLLEDLAGRHLAAQLPVDRKSRWRMVAGPGGALFHSDSPDRQVPVRLELWHSEPTDDPSEPWQSAADGVLQPDSRRLRLCSITGAMTPHVLLLETTRPHHIRAYLHASLDPENPEGYETDIQEHWLLRLWPTTEPATQH